MRYCGKPNYFRLPLVIIISHLWWYSGWFMILLALPYYNHDIPILWYECLLCYRVYHIIIMISPFYECLLCYWVYHIIIIISPFYDMNVYYFTGFTTLYSTYPYFMIWLFMILLGLPHYQWEFQDPKMEVLYHIRPCFVGISPHIGLTNRPYIW